MGWIKIRVLGKGSYGVVYQAIPTAPGSIHSQEAIAIKSCCYKNSASLRKEERIMKNLASCPEILHCLGSTISIDKGFCVYNLLLEYAPYGTLSGLIKKNHLTELRVIQAFVRMLLKGLHFIHKKGFVHCDLKPDNILVFPSQDGSNYQLKIADFGLSKNCEEGINANDWKYRFRGTPYYMSPESVSYGQIEAPMDIWSLGCIVIEMITGKPAWWGCESEEELMFKLVLQKKAPELPQGLSEICKNFLSKCFAIDPWKRWTAEMLLNHPFLLDPDSIINRLSSMFSRSAPSSSCYSLFPEEGRTTEAFVRLKRCGK
ncbi:Protein kinase-like protein [Quillaja saponaria]|uniref:Protein kinase-like protein n=1 Tax=Quillaja saponaria TaxID=32244 RepID=A0AAD7L3D5_QUISA|nr:Protein kinase-like protein [Quillaja saponaria]